MRITLFISSLSSGGAERVMSIMANYWAEKGHDVTLMTQTSAASDFYALHQRVNRVALEVMRNSANIFETITNGLKRLSKIRREIKRSRPDVVISFIEQTNVVVLLATLGLGLKVIVSERTNPAMHNVRKIWHWLRRLTYKSADVIVVQTATVGNWIKKNIGKGTPVIVIPNSVTYSREETGDKESLSALTGASISSRTVIAMGRLGYEKGFDLLLKAFAKLAHNNSDWILVIFGDGNERKNLTELADNLNIADKVHLPGRIKDPMRFLRQADIFVMPSRYEGFPNALLEAMACGLPVVSFDCQNGPNDIIRDGVDGILVPPEDIDALASKIERLMNDEAERRHLASRAIEVVDRFSIEKVMGMWENAIGHKC